MDFKTIDSLFERAHGRPLLEHEVYMLLKAAGIGTPAFHFLPAGENVRETELEEFNGSRVVLKVVSPQILHKSDVGGVRFTERNCAAINRVAVEMTAAVPQAFLRWRERSGEKGRPSPSEEQIRSDILGILICEVVEYPQNVFGSEILLGLRLSREFGPVVTMGLGGVEVEYLSLIHI